MSITIFLNKQKTDNSILQRDNPLNFSRSKMRESWANVEGKLNMQANRIEKHLTSNSLY